MNTMNDNQLLEALQLYLMDITYDYAVMIDGPWGCGKSYFLKKTFIPKLNSDNRKYIYISLYGMSSINEINKQIYLQNIFGNKGVELKSKLFGFAGSIAFDIMEKKGIEVDKIQSAADLLKSNISIGEDTVLIFDDLERAKINVNELLGFINGFVEHQHLKTIIICNEQELEDSLDNIELKYLIAANNNITFTHPISTDDLFGGLGYYQKTEIEKKDTSKELISIEELKNRVNKLFDEKTEYKKIKEKVIGNTFFYSCDLKNACSSILNCLSNDNNSKNDETQEFTELMRKYLPELCEILMKLEHFNLRTFQFFLSKMFQFYDVLYIIDKSLVDVIFKENVQFALQESIRYKSGKENLNNLNYIQSDIADYIAGKILISSNFIETLIKKYDLLISEDSISENLITLYNWCEYNEQSVNRALIFLKDNIQKISHTHYKQLLTTLAVIENYGIIDSNFTDTFLEKLNSALYNNTDAKNILYELKDTILEVQNGRKIYQKYLNKLSYPKNSKIINPLHWWIDDSFNINSIRNNLPVYDFVYLTEREINGIIKRMKESSKASPIWELCAILDYLFIKNCGIWNNSINLDENLKSINNLLEQLNQYVQSNHNIDKIIKYAIKRLVIDLNRIKEELVKQ